MSDSVARDPSFYEHLLMDSIPSMLAYWDADLRCCYANRAYERWFGVSPASLLGTSLRDLLGPALFALNAPHVLAALRGQEQTFERDVPGPGGMVRRSLAHYIPDGADGLVRGFLVQMTDVTTLKLAQSALQRSEEYLRALFMLGSEGIVVADRDGRYVDLNDVVCAMLGYRRDELLGKSFEDLLCAAELQRVPQARARLHAGEPLVEEWALQRKDGSVLPAEVRAKFLPDGRRVGFLRDITAYKRTLAAERDLADSLERRVRERTAELERVGHELQVSHEALRASEQRYHTLVDWSPEAIAVHRGGSVVYVNCSAVELFGARSEHDLLGKPIVDLIHPEFHAFVLGRVQAGAADGTPSQVAEVVLGKLDGTPIDAEIQGAPILYEGEASLLVSIRDVTARKQAEHGLRTSKARLRGIFESATDAILSADETQTIVAANPAAATMFRCAVSEMVGAPLERFVPERHRDRHRRMVQGFGDGVTTARSMGQVRDVMGLRADGEEFPIDAGISHLTHDGKPLYTVILRDITERRAADRALLASRAKLEAALSSMNDAVFICDVQGRFVELNDAFASFHRFSSKDECAATLASDPALLEMATASGERVPLEQWVVARALRGETGSNVEFNLRRKDTGQSWVGSYSFAPIRSEQGAIVGAVVTARDITGIKRAQAELAHSHADLRRLVAAQAAIQEEERKRIARELHDDLQQTLAVIRIELGVIGERLAVDPISAVPLLSEADRLAMAAIASTRRIVNDLRPQMLEDLGLVPSLEALTRQFAARTGIPCQLDAPAELGEALIGLAAVTTCLYRLTQEALNNVAKHSRATTVLVSLTHAGDARIGLRISDNGVGIGAGDRRKQGAFGLLGMAERVLALGGQLRIDSVPDGGTTIDVLVPLADRPLVPDILPEASASTLPRGAPDGADGNAVEPPGPGQAADHLLQGVIDALAGNVAVLDRPGTIRFVNRAWRAFAERNGDPGLRGSGPGINYLEVCRRSAASDSSALPVLRGLGEVLAGEREVFVSEYPCDLPAGRNWFRMHVAAVTADTVIVTHVDLSSRVSLASPERIAAEPP